MNIVLVHNFYQQAGGEDQVFAEECALLQSHGHRVEKFTVHNSAVESMGKLEMARKTVWNGEAAAALAQVTRQTQAQIVHFHNTFPLISPAAYSAVKKEGAAVVQTLHNYRLMCPAATFYRDGHVCEDCLGKAVPLPAVRHACYRESRAATAAVAAMLTVHRGLGTYRKDVDAYVALTEFSRSKFIEAGFPSGRVFTKANFVNPDPGVGKGNGDYAVFVGRLTQEKGIPVLLRAWEQIGNRLPIIILGDGPMREQVESAAARVPGIRYLGRRPIPEIYEALGAARMLVFPSVWYEGLPRTIVESYATGTPVLASRLGSMVELIKPGQTGALFEPGSSDDLIRQVDKLLSDRTQWASMRIAARKEFEEKYTAATNYPALMNIYQQAIRGAHRSELEAQPDPSQAASPARVPSMAAPEMGSSNPRPVVMTGTHG